MWSDEQKQQILDTMTAQTLSLTAIERAVLFLVVATTFLVLLLLCRVVQAAVSR